jgi:galactokinase
MENELIQSYHRVFGSMPEVISTAPGRINLIGEHTDYNGGFVLPAAIDRHVVFMASKRVDSGVRVWSESFQQEKGFDLDEDLESKQGGWIDYVKGVFWILVQKGASLHGIDALVWGDVPLESGLSSSAAFEVSVLHALNEMFCLQLAPLEMAQLAQSSENDFVGVKCGLMDQFISVFGKKDRAILLDCETLEYAYLPLKLTGAGLGILVYDTGVRRDLASSDYNKRRSEAAEALKKLADSRILSYKDVSLEALSNKRSEMGETLFRRARHVVTENERVQKASHALQANDFQELGKLLFLSHKSLRDDYQVSCPELDLLYECGKRSQDCLGARLTGAGFGGSGIALVQATGIPAFKKMISDVSGLRGFKKPTFYAVEIGEGAHVHGPPRD